MGTLPASLEARQWAVLIMEAVQTLELNGSQRKPEGINSNWHVYKTKQASPTGAAFCASVCHCMVTSWYSNGIRYTAWTFHLSRARLLGTLSLDAPTCSEALMKSHGLKCAGRHEARIGLPPRRKSQSCAAES